MFVLGILLGLIIGEVLTIMAVALCSAQKTLEKIEESEENKEN